MRILILAAGYGTRLYPLTRDFPKPLIPINGKPVLNFLMEKVSLWKKNFLIRQVAIVTNNKFYKDFLRWKQKYGVSAKIINDGSSSPDDKLGAIKDIKFAIETTNDDWFVLGGDNLFEDSLVGFLKFAQRKKPYPAIGVYDLKNKKQASRFGVVHITAQRLISELREKPKHPASTLVASCIYFFPKESLKFLDYFLESEGLQDASGKYIAWLVREHKVFGYILKGRWLDVGHYDSLRLAESQFKP